MEDQYTQLLLRMPVQLKAALQREADIQGRKLTQEVNMRLKVSLAAHGPTLQNILAREAAGIAPAPPSYTARPTATNSPANEKSPDYTLTGIDQAMLAIFRAMPPEKQLALLSLFR